MNELLESYINGNIGYVKQQLINAPYSFSEFYAAYVDQYSPSHEDLQLFVTRLGD